MTVFNICKICNRKLDISLFNSREDKNIRFEHLNWCHQLYYELQVKHISEDKTINYFNPCDCEYCIKEQA